MMIQNAKEANMTDEVIPAALDDNMPPDEVITTDPVLEVIPGDTATPEIEVSDEPQIVEVDEKQKALNKLAFEKREEKRQRVAAQEEVARLTALVPAKPVTVESEPKLEDFDFDEQAFNSALITYKVKQETQSFTRQQEEKQVKQRKDKAQADFNVKAAKFTETTPDYAETVAQLPQFPTETLDAIMQADNGPELANYLGKHLDIADSIASLSPMQAAMHLGQISARISSAKPVTKPSAAPDPIKPVDSSGSVSKSQDDMSMEEVYNS